MCNSPSSLIALDCVYSSKKCSTKTEKRKQATRRRSAMSNIAAGAAGTQHPMHFNCAPARSHTDNNRQHATHSGRKDSQGGGGPGTPPRAGGSRGVPPPQKLLGCAPRPRHSPEAAPSSSTTRVVEEDYFWDPGHNKDTTHHLLPSPLLLTFPR